MGRRKLEFFAFGKLIAPAVAAIVIVSLGTMNACTPSDRSTEGEDLSMVQNAAEAEAAEAKIAQEGTAGKADEVKAKGDKAEKKAEKKAVAEKAPAHQDKQAAAGDHKPTARRPASMAGGVFVVQVGAFKVKENAEKLQAKLKDAGYPVELSSIEHSKNGLLHLVRFSPTQNRAEAETVIEDLQSKQDLHAQILTMPQAH